MYLCTSFSSLFIYLFLYLLLSCILAFWKKAWPFVNIAKLARTFLLFMWWATELSQKSSNFTCICSLSSERLYLCCWSYSLFLDISMCKAGLEAWIQGSQGYLYHYKTKWRWHLFICSFIHLYNKFCLLCAKLWRGPLEGWMSRCGLAVMELSWS